MGRGGSAPRAVLDLGCEGRGASAPLRLAEVLGKVGLPSSLAGERGGRPELVKLAHNGRALGPLRWVEGGSEDGGGWCLGAESLDRVGDGDLCVVRLGGLRGGGGDGGSTGAEDRRAWLEMFLEKKPDKVDPAEVKRAKWTR